MFNEQLQSLRNDFLTFDAKGVRLLSTQDDRGISHVVFGAPNLGKGPPLLSSNDIENQRRCHHAFLLFDRAGTHCQGKQSKPYIEWAKFINTGVRSHLYFRNEGPLFFSDNWKEASIVAIDLLLSKTEVDISKAITKSEARKLLKVKETKFKQMLKAGELGLVAVAGTQTVRMLQSEYEKLVK